MPAPTNSDAETTPSRGVVVSDACSAEGSLSPEQIKNWRNVLCGMVGPYALIMPDGEVQAFKDKLQSEVSGQNTEIVDA